VNMKILDIRKLYIWLGFLGVLTLVFGAGATLAGFIFENMEYQEWLEFSDHGSQYEMTVESKKIWTGGGSQTPDMHEVRGTLSDSGEYVEIELDPIIFHETKIGDIMVMHKHENKFKYFDASHKSVGPITLNSPGPKFCFLGIILILFALLIKSLEVNNVDQTEPPSTLS